MSTGSIIASDAKDGLFRFEVGSVVSASPADVWLRVSTMRGVNDELWPLVRMSHPRGVDRLDGPDVPLGCRAFRSWLLLFGILPFDYDDLTFERIEPGRGFLESSTMASQRRWIHERRIDPLPSGSLVVDRVAFEPRVRALGPLLARLFRAVFRYRHWRLRRAFAHAQA